MQDYSDVRSKIATLIEALKFLSPSGKWRQLPLLTKPPHEATWEDYKELERQLQRAYDKERKPLTKRKDGRQQLCLSDALFEDGN